MMMQNQADKEQQENELQICRLVCNMRKTHAQCQMM